MSPMIRVMVFLGYGGLKAPLTVFVATTTDGVTIPQKNPHKWFVMLEDDGSMKL